VRRYFPKQYFSTKLLFPLLLVSKDFKAKYILGKNLQIVTLIIAILI